AGIEQATRVPPVEWRLSAIDDRCPFLLPVDRFRRFGPERFRVPQRVRVRCLVRVDRFHAAIIGKTQGPGVSGAIHVETDRADCCSPLLPRGDDRGSVTDSTRHIYW